MIEAALHFQAEIIKILDATIPQKTSKPCSKLAPWLTKELKNFLARKRGTFRQISRIKSVGKIPPPELISKFRRLSRQAKKLVDNAKKNYTIRQFENVSSPQEYWALIRRLEGKENSHVPTLFSTGLMRVPLVTDQEKVDALATQFLSQFNQDPNLQASTAGLTISGPLQQHPNPSFIPRPVDVAQSIQSLKDSTSSGPDGIPSTFLKKMGAVIVPSILAILDKILATGEFPHSWKTARIAPIPKTPNPQVPSQFRGISILPAVSKIAERWLLSCLRPFLYTNRAQFAFKHGSSTEDALCSLQLKIGEAFNSAPGGSCYAFLSYDCEKAFDRLQIPILLDILASRGVPLELLRILQSYLVVRSQFVQMGEAKSTSTTNPSGIPQGSVLGPLLWNVYIDSLLDVQLSADSLITLFADDCGHGKLLRGGHLAEDAELLQRDIEKLCEHYSKLGLTLNPAKTHLTVLSPTGAGFDLELNVNGTPIPISDSLKYLGVLLDNKLSFSKNAQVTSVKAKRSLGVLYQKIGCFASTQVLQNLYVCKILPIILYSVVSCFPSNLLDFDKYEKINRYAARLITNDYTSSYADLLRKCKLKPVANHYLVRAMSLMYKATAGGRVLGQNLPIKQHPNIRSGLRSESTTHRLQVSVPLLDTRREVIGRRLPVYKMLSLWNDLPTEFIDKNLSSFKRDIDLSLFDDKKYEYLFRFRRL